MSTSDPAPGDHSPLAPPQHAWGDASREWALRVGDSARLAALANTALMDSPAEEDFDRLTQLLARLLGTPMALITLVDDQKQFFKSTHGVKEPLRTERQIPLSHSFCKHVVANGFAARRFRRSRRRSASRQRRRDDARRHRLRRGPDLRRR